MVHGNKMNNYQKNIKYQTDEFKRWLKKNDRPVWIEPFKSKNGNDNFLISPKQIHAYDLFDPTKEAQLIADGTDCYEQDVSVIIGAGYGYLIDEILSKGEEKHRTIVFESNPYFIDYLFNKHDYSDHIKNHRLIFCPGVNDLIYAMELVEGGIPVRQWFLSVENYCRHRIEYMEIAVRAQQVINQLNCNTGTVRGAGKTIADNDILNLPYVIKERGVNDLANLFKDKPAVVVSTGPSLEKNVRLLGECKDNVIIIAVGQALRVLLGYDITPDFICTVDFGEVNMAHFKGLMDSSVPLICLNRTYAPLLKQYQGPKFITASPQPEGTPHAILNDKGHIAQGGSVAHLCLGSAVLLGCDPIMLIGQDLAYSDTNKSHIAQADAGGNIEIENNEIRWKVTDQRTSLHNQNHSMGPVMHVDGYFGKPVVTNAGLASFITSFENMIDVYGKTVINSTQGGAKIKGTIQMTLKRAVKKCCRDKIDKKVLNKYLKPLVNGNELVKKVIPELKKDVEYLRKIIKYSKLGISTAKKILKAKERGYLEREMKKNEVYSNKAHEYAKKLPLVMLAIYDESKTIQQKELLVKGGTQHLLNNDEDLKIRVKRNRLILTAALESSKNLVKNYKETIKILEENKPIHFKPEPINLDDAEEYLKNGNFAHPYIDAKKILANIEQTIPYHTAIEILNKATELRLMSEPPVDHDEEDRLLMYNHMVEKAMERGRENKDIEGALRYIKYALWLYPNGEKALWGKATALSQLERCKESIEIYRKLLDIDPLNNSYMFELALTYGKNNQKQECIDLLKEVLSKTDEYDHYLAGLGDMLFDIGDKKAASEYYHLYLKKFPADKEVVEKLHGINPEMTKTLDWLIK